MSSQSSPIKPINLLGDEITNIAATNNKKSNNADDDEKMDEMIMQMAEYEVNQDSYRGIKFLGNANDKKVVSPWDICNWGILSLPKSATQQHEDGLLDSKNPTTMVRLLTESCCPSILAWTEQYLEDEAKKSQKTKKRKSSSSTADVPRAHLGKRPLDCHYRCPCDSNPFCLASMGGFMNQLLTERCQNTTAVAIDSDDGDNNDNDLISNKNTRPRSLGLFNSNNKNENSKKHVTCPDTLAHCNDVVDVDVDVDVEAKTESGENSDVFAFMGSDVSNTNKNDVDARTTKVKSSSSSTILTCKRLGPDWSKPAIGDPAEVFLTNEIENQHLNETEYSVTTQDDIDRLRGYQDIDFRDYVKKILEVSNCGKITMDEYIQAIKEWHKSLIFVNPTNCEHDVANDRITIALPPGIQNLGATCYLNTQLQCLAQNPVFLNGIFSWRPVNSSHNMNGVMTKLQKLLAELLVGVDGKYTSLDFSNALGLEHNEQQDPNEFARLLFDRMEESFQQCSSDLGTGGDDLGRLLQRIFHGTTTYETCCMECNKISVRSEGFMDLNLPIVQRQSNEEDETDNSDGSDKIGKDTAAFTKRKRRKQGSIKDAFAKREDTDVQYCLDQYTKAEMLDGENQYFCDYCKCKQNAKRVMKLTELPPVLNIQLSRYVFDREKFVKKKLMDKVRLPTVLNVNRYGGSVSKNKGEPVEKKYILCAVMRHQGTSAYSGHYVAEAMDWTTGQWYEFNDETVKVLSESSSSYVPDNISDDEPIVNGDGLMGNLKSFWNGNQGGNKASTAGSQDAYNMYYVDEEYLAKNAVDTIDRRQSLNANTNHGGFNDDVLSNLIREKEKRYGDLTE
jgi:ubiquitin C-terminal hydrolase